ncbi:leucine-rich repeat-containing protein 69 isoform X2 [Macrotis lagotis]|uniref:leucine-rich repeat-containing protein 69 isoform X2 n=1 Tax=Macrotis lagotis TaxID=92651 RepID=UPI003D68075D
MSERLFYGAMRGKNTTTVTIRGKDIMTVPPIIQNLIYLKHLDLMSNQISKLCPEFSYLTKLTKLNLANNKLEEVPEELMYLKNLEVLYLFKNMIKSFSPRSLDNLQNLNTLNLNKNMLKTIPPEIKSLQNLKTLYLNNNELIDIPKEICSLAYLSDLQLNYNQLVCLPEEFKSMQSLRKLSLARNFFEVFPTVQQMKLKEFFCEENPFLKKVPIYVRQKEEIFPLQEIAGRYIMNQLYKEAPMILQTIIYYPEILEILANYRECMLCGKHILNSGIECVIFIPPKKNWKTSCEIEKVPHETVMCSKTCFELREPNVFRLQKR